MDRSSTDTQITQDSGTLVTTAIPAPSGRLAGAMTAVAGAPAAICPGARRGVHRRGSFLVLVVGTLALLSVAAILYVTIGNRDVRTRAAIEKKERLADIPAEFAAYVSEKIIAADALATTYDLAEVETTDTNGRTIPVLTREAMDYPGIDWTRRSDSTDPAEIFSPVGTYDASLGVNGIPPKWLPSDPWLAASEPIFMDYALAGPSDPARPYLDNRDWLQISNVAPDGRFVNLWNLRNNFDAQPGVGNGTNGRPRLSTELTLWDDAGTPTTQTDFGAAADPNVPAHFTARQRRAFRPVNDGVYEPSDQRYPGYQWADTDGDGMYDARLFELVDARDPNNPINLLSTDTTSNYRWFFATRIVDLSGRVNVTTAGDMLAASTREVPAGLTPADVDLRRLLTMVDVYDQNNAPFGSGVKGGYEGIFQNLVPNRNELNLITYGGTPDTTPPTTTYTPNSTDSGYDAGRAFDVGRFAYDSLRLGLVAGSPPPLFSPDGTVELRGPNLNTASASPAVTILRLESRSSLFDFSNPANRRGYFNTVLRGFSSGQGVFTEVTGTTSGGTEFNPFRAFGVTDQVELLSYNASNDAGVTSALEQAVASRDNGAPVAPAELGSTRFSPLRDNRPLELELRRYTGAFPNNVAPGSPFERTMLHFASDLRQRITTTSSSRQLRSIRGVDPNRLNDAELKIDARQAASNPSLAFAGYADALLPTASILGSWADPTGNPLATLSYGYRGPHLATLVAGSMAANLGPTAGLPAGDSFTLLLSRDLRDDLDDGNLGVGTDDRDRDDDAKRFPGWHNGRRFDLGDARLAQAGEPISAAAVNIYPVRPQAFLTEVSSYTVYTDADDGDGGDDEEGLALSSVTIKSDLGTDGSEMDNTDALYQVLAFKLHNPFNSAVRLSGNAALPNRSDPSANPALLNEINVTDPAFPPLDRDPQEYYYLQYRGRTYKLASLVERTFVSVAEEATSQGLNPPVPARGDDGLIGQYYNADPDLQYITLRGIEIPAGGTVVCYALSQSPRKVGQRIANLDTSITPAQRNSPTFIRNIIESRLAEDSDIAGVHWVPEMSTSVAFDDRDSDPTYGRVYLPIDTAAGTPSMEFRKVARGSSAYTPPTAPLQEEIRLWRTVRNGLEADTDFDVPNLDNNEPENVTLPANYWDGQTAIPSRTVTLPPRNNPQNDQLMDRFKLPVGVTVNRVLPGYNPPGTPASAVDQLGVAPTDPLDIEDQNGLTVTLWATVRRPANPSATIPLGAFPAYCLEPKRWPVGSTWNTYEQDGVTITPPTGAAPPAVLTRSQFGIPSTEGMAEAVSDWRADMVGSTWSFGTIGQAPNNMTANPLLDAARVNGSVPTSTNIFTNVSEIILSAENITNRLRPADMLLPIGIAPMYAPLNSAGVPWTDSSSGPAADPAGVNRWTTLAEAMAMALGFDRRPGAGVAYPPADLTQHYYPQGGGAGPFGAAQKTPLDRGNLRIDDYSAFFDDDTDKVFSPLADDRRAGLEIPIALNILDVFHTTGTSTDSLERGVPGLININTASLAVARSLPLLSPPPDVAANGSPWWWWTGPTSWLNSTSDVAATLMAFRDKNTVALRLSSYVTIPSGTLTTVFFNDDDGSGGWLPPDTTVELLTGRGLSSKIDAIGEQPGIRSLGAVLAARFRDVTLESRAWPLNIDFMGFDTTTPGGTTARNNGREGLDSVLYRSGGTFVTDGIANEFKERLTIANGMLASVTTRSDVYAVWFVVQGYRKGDVEGLTGNDPLTPSVQRRFLMIVDRSNVKARGDKPKILALRELPL